MLPPPTEEQLAWVSVSQREWAQRNPLAVFRTPLTVEDYLAMPYIVAPLRRPDLTVISDGGTAIIVTTAERANARIKDEFGGHYLRVRGHLKAFCHLMFGVVALAADSILRMFSATFYIHPV